MCGSMVDIQSAMAEIWQDFKALYKCCIIIIIIIIKKPQCKNIMTCPIP